MKVLCSACEAAEARVLCCADEAALCARCDRDVHAANRLASKHHRLPLLPSTPAAAATNCDICQESHAYFFCAEDRALLCRSCDVAVHTANAFVSAHRRFLLTGVQVGLDPEPQEEEPEPLEQEPEPLPPSNAASAEEAAPLPPLAAKDNRSPAPLYSDDDLDWAAAGPDGGGITGSLPDWSVVDEQFSAHVPRPAPEPVVIAAKPLPKRSPCGPIAVAFGGQGGVTGGMPDWQMDDFFGFSEFNAGLGFTENGTSKADRGKLGSTDGSPNGRSSSGSALAQDFFGQVPEFNHWAVPELPSPPTASGLFHWHEGPKRHGNVDAATEDATAVFVPDICSPENPFRCFESGAGDQPTKHRRRC